MPRTLRWDPPRTPFQLEHVAVLGVTHRVLETAVRRKKIMRLATGVYVAADAIPEDDAAQQHLLAARAHQILLPRAIASHHTAALAWELELDDPERAATFRPSFIEPDSHGTRSRRSRKLILSVRDLPAEQRVCHPSGLIVTSRDRTAVDVAAGLALPEALITLDAAARMNLQEQVGRSWLRDHYTKPQVIANSVRPLTEASRSAATQFTRRSLGVAITHADARRESAAESLSFGHMVLAELPLPELQVRFTDESGDLYTDFLWRKAGLVGEVDGNAKYRTPEDLVAERRRDARLRAMGLRVEHWEASDIRRRPHQVMSGLARLLGC